MRSQDYLLKTKRGLIKENGSGYGNKKGGTDKFIRRHRPGTETKIITVRNV